MSSWSVTTYYKWNKRKDKKYGPYVDCRAYPGVGREGVSEQVEGIVASYYPGVKVKERKLKRSGGIEMVIYLGKAGELDENFVREMNALFN